MHREQAATVRIPDNDTITNKTMPLLAMNNKWPGAMRIALGCLLLVAALRCEAQNLVPNPSFELLEEDCDSLQCCFNVGSRPLDWYSWQNSPEYFNACAYGAGQDSLVDVPQNGIAFQYASDGDAYIGMIAIISSDLEYREYAGVQLLQPLTIGETYYCSFMVNAAYGGNYWGTNGACNNIGMLFSMESNAWPGISGPPFGFRNDADVYSTSIISDTADWTLVSGSFVADSAYPYLVLGNFFENALTDTLSLTGIPTGGAYVLIDQVCVTISPEGCGWLGLDEAGALPASMLINLVGHDLMVKWPGHDRFEVVMYDPSGRSVGIVESGAVGRGISLENMAAGAYVVLVVDGGERAFSKFVVVE